MEALGALPFWFQAAWFTSGWTAVGFIAWLLLTGRGGIALRREVDQALKLAETYKTAWETSETSKQVLAEQMGETNQQINTVIEFATTADRYLKALDDVRVRNEAEEQARARLRAEGVT
jgi:hypothetical protein